MQGDNTWTAEEGEIERWRKRNVDGRQKQREKGFK